MKTNLKTFMFTIEKIKLFFAIVFRKPVPWATWYNRISPRLAWQVACIVWDVFIDFPPRPNCSPGG